MSGSRFAWLGLLALAASQASTARAAWPEPRPLDRGRLASVGLRVIESRHATLVTDLPSSGEIDSLVNVIDAAVPQWCERFSYLPRRVPDWRVRVYLVGEETRFRSLGLWPEVSSEFPHGLSLGYEVWLREQPSDYYRRSLLLHEATHSFMATLLGGCGPAWHMEGVAELCGAHRWEAASRTLRMGVVPVSSEASPRWGRVRLVRDAVAGGRRLSIDAVMQTDNRRVLPAESYAWVWALAKFLDAHPRYGDRFRAMSAAVRRDDFDRLFVTAFAEDRPLLDAEWGWFVQTLTYGHDVAREAIEPWSATSLAPEEVRTVTIQADRGWQATGVRLSAGERAAIAASGRFVIARDPDGTPWPCEANGVTLAWRAGQPVGRLLATVRTRSGFAEPEPIGLAGELRTAEGGGLFLRVNDAPNSLAENEGELRVSIRR